MDLNINIADEGKIRKVQKGIDILVRFAEIGEQMMSEVTPFLENITTFMDRTLAAVESTAQDVTNLTAKVNELQAKLDEQQAGAVITPEEREALAQTISRQSAIASRAEEVDNMTPPLPVA